MSDETAALAAWAQDEKAVADWREKVVDYFTNPNCRKPSEYDASFPLDEDQVVIRYEALLASREAALASYQDVIDGSVVQMNETIRRAEAAEAKLRSMGELRDKLRIVTPATNHGGALINGERKRIANKLDAILGAQP